MESLGLLILCWGAGFATICTGWFAFRAGLQTYRNFKQRNARIGNPTQAA